MRSHNRYQNVSSLTAQARAFPLKKPAGFHWDFFLLGCTTFIAGIIGIPMPNGLVPQAPVHTDSLTIYETDLSIISTEEGEGAEIRRPIVRATAVVEQRISHFLMGLAIIGTMTGPLLIVLHTMPEAVFAGVFLIVGVRANLFHFTSILWFSSVTLTLLPVGIDRVERHR